MIACPVLFQLLIIFPTSETWHPAPHLALQKQRYQNYDRYYIAYERRNKEMRGSLSSHQNLVLVPSPTILLQFL